MTLRHLSGALRWVLIESVQTQLLRMQERLRENGLENLWLDTTTSPPESPHLSSSRGGQAGNARKKWVGFSSLLYTTKGAKKPECGAKNATGTTCQTEEQMLRHQVSWLDGLCAVVLSEVEKCREAGDDIRAHVLEGELQEAMNLRSTVFHYLRLFVDEKGRLATKDDGLTHNCQSEGALASIYARRLTPNVYEGMECKADSKGAFSSNAHCCSEKDEYGGESDDGTSPFELLKGDTLPQPLCTSMNPLARRKDVASNTFTDDIHEVKLANKQQKWRASSFVTVCGVAVASGRQMTNRPSTSQESQEMYRSDILSEIERKGIRPSNLSSCSQRERSGFTTATTTKGINVVDASGTSVSLLVPHVVRSAWVRRRCSRKSSGNAITPVAVDRRDSKSRLLSTKKMEAQPEQAKGLPLGICESIEAAAVAVDATIEVVAASSTSAVDSSRAAFKFPFPQRLPSFVRHDSLTQEEERSSMPRQQGLTRKEFQTSHSERGMHSFSAADSRSQFVLESQARANQLVSKKQYEAAIQVYTEAIEQNPTNDILYCNRAAAYLLINKYDSALMDCGSVLRRSPSNLQAHWQAAKTLVYKDKMQDAKRHYRVAQELCTDPVESRLICKEIKAAQMFEKYYIYIKDGRWEDSVSCADQLLCVFGSTGPLSLPWRCRKLEASLHLDPVHALERVKELREEYPNYTDLLFLHAKCLFYCAHDPSSTKNAIELIRAARKQKGYMEDQEDSRYVHLECALLSFERSRNRGNTAYASGNWSAAYDAYTRCLSIDPRNKLLVAVTYCNRAAVCIYGGRWADALEDVKRSIDINERNVKAYTRRARIYLHYFSRKTVVGIDYLELAIRDLTKAVELAPTNENRQQLASVLLMRREEEEQQREHQSAKTKSDVEGGNNGDTSWKTRQHRCSQRPASQSSFSRQKHNSNKHGDDDNDSNRKGCQGLVNSRGAKCARVLGLDSVSGLDAALVVKAYHEAALRWHPDKWAGSDQREHKLAEEKFKEINVAYQTLRRMIAP